VGYRGKLAEQERARGLRGQAWTINEIVAELGVSKSSVSLWARGVPFDEAERSRRAGENGNRGARRRGPSRRQVAKAAEIEQLAAERLLRVQPHASSGHGLGGWTAILRLPPSGVAQPAEQGIVNPKVVGSSPTPGAFDWACSSVVRAADS
jgi:hypothetical protein